jgi:hypothetical protein
LRHVAHYFQSSLAGLEAKTQGPFGRKCPNERNRMRSQIVTASKRNIRYLPYVFTENGVVMAANVLNSPRAVEVSVFVVRAFVKLR